MSTTRPAGNRPGCVAPAPPREPIASGGLRPAAQPETATGDGPHQWPAAHPDTERVSVVIALYNHERFIRRTIESLLHQTLKPFEIIVVDDGSRDRSAGVMRELCADHPEIIFWSHPNQGAHYSLSAGIHRATGEFVAILNSDDLYDPQRLEACVAQMRDHPDTRALVTAVQFIDEEDRPLANPWYDQGLVFLTQEGDLSLALANANIIVSTSNLFLRRSVFDRIGYFAPLRYTHDLDFCLRLLAYGEKILFLDRPLLSYRIHGCNTIAENRQQVAIERAAVLAFYLYLRWRGLKDPEGWESYLTRFSAILDAQQLGEIARSFVARAMGRSPQGAALEPLGTEGEFRHFLDRSGVHWHLEDPGKGLTADLRSALKRQSKLVTQKQRTWIAELETAKRWLQEQAQRLQETLDQQEAVIQEQLKQNQKLDEGLTWLRAHNLQLTQALEDRDALLAKNTNWIGELTEARNWLAAEHSRLEQALAEKDAWIASLQTGKTWLEEERERFQGLVSELEAHTEAQATEIGKLNESQEWLRAANRSLEQALAEREGVLAEQADWIQHLEAAKEWLAAQSQRLEQALKDQTEQNSSLLEQIKTLKTHVATAPPSGALGGAYSVLLRSTQGFQDGEEADAE